MTKNIVLLPEDRWMTQLCFLPSNFEITRLHSSREFTPIVTGVSHVNRDPFNQSSLA